MSSWASTPNAGGQLAAALGATVRYVVAPASFKSVVPLLDSMAGAVGKPAGAGPGGAAGTVMNRECAFTLATTKSGSAALSDSAVSFSSTGGVGMPGAPPGGSYTIVRSNFAASTAFGRA